MNISIKKPCTENWDAMKPDSNGRFCNSCAKTVIDFTEMTVPEISNYLLQNNNSTGICGRMQQSKLTTLQFILPRTLFTANKWKRFLAAACISFSMILFGCQADYRTPEQTKNNVEYTKGKIEVKSDTVNDTMLGGIYIPNDTTITGKQTKTTQCKLPEIVEIDSEAVMGFISTTPKAYWPHLEIFKNQEVPLLMEEVKLDTTNYE